MEIIIKSRVLCKFLGIGGIALYPFIIVKTNDPILINHERIHLAQQRELHIFKFYWLYFKYYFQLKKQFRINPHMHAYLNIPFEREAYRNQHNLLYLKSRKLNSWKNYFYTKPIYNL